MIEWKVSILMLSVALTSVVEDVSAYWYTMIVILCGFVICGTFMIMMAVLRKHGELSRIRASHKVGFCLWLASICWIGSFAGSVPEILFCRMPFIGFCGVLIMVSIAVSVMGIGGFYHRVLLTSVLSAAAFLSVCLGGGIVFLVCLWRLSPEMVIGRYCFFVISCVLRGGITWFGIRNHRC